MARVWDDFLTERDKKVFDAAGYGREAEFKGRPALLVIDINFGFVGDCAEEILDSIRKVPNSGGAEGWQARERLVGELADKQPLSTFEFPQRPQLARGPVVVLAIDLPLLH